MLRGKTAVPIPVPKNYAKILVNDFGADEVFSLVDMVAGPTIHAYVNPARDGTGSGWDLQNAAGPVAGTLAPYSDGANDVGRIGTAGLDAIFDGTEGGYFIWAKPINAVYWADAALGVIMKLRANGSNVTNIYKAGSNAGLVFQWRAGGGTIRTIIDTSLNGTADWFSCTLTWSNSADEVKAYINESQVQSTLQASGVWAGSVNNDTTVIGALNSTPTSVWNGWLAYAAVRFGSVWTPADILGMHSAVT